MLLAQETLVVFLDEPATYLGIFHQMEIMRFADRVAVMAGGTPDEVNESGILEEAFGVRVGVQEIGRFDRQYFSGENNAKNFTR